MSDTETNAKLDEIIRLLACINAALSKQGVPASANVKQASTLPAPAANTATGTEREFFIIGEAHVWKSGNGSFNAAKINHEDGGDIWSLGIKASILAAVNDNDWLHKGDVVAAAGAQFNELYNGVPRPKLMVDTLRIISRANGSAPTQAVPAPDTPQIPQIPKIQNTQNTDTEEDVPF